MQLLTLAAVTCFFHVTEFALAAVYMREELGWHSWLVSWPYCLAMAAGITEFVLELKFMPALKTSSVAAWAYYVGLGMIFLGEFVRKTGMVTAGSNFTHKIKSEKRQQHVLVTWGIYRFIRHPGYAGWFLWAVGTQVMLANPVCTVAFTCVVWSFFKSRITAEEWYLVRFFGNAYIQYRQQTATFIPFIS